MGSATNCGESQSPPQLLKVTSASSASSSTASILQDALASATSPLGPIALRNDRSVSASRNSTRSRNPASWLSNVPQRQGQFAALRVVDVPPPALSDGGVIYLGESWPRAIAYAHARRLASLDGSGCSGISDVIFSHHIPGPPAPARLSGLGEPLSAGLGLPLARLEHLGFCKSPLQSGAGLGGDASCARGSAREEMLVLRTDFRMRR